MISNPDRMQDYTQDYQLAEAAYLQGNYEKAATIIDTLVAKFQDDPSVRLLRGHIYCYGLYQYEIGKKEYEKSEKQTRGYSQKTKIRYEDIIKHPILLEGEKKWKKSKRNLVSWFLLTEFILFLFLAGQVVDIFLCFLFLVIHS